MKPSKNAKHTVVIYTQEFQGAIFEMAEMTSRDKFSSGFFKQIFQVISGDLFLVIFSNDGNIFCTNKKI